MTDLSSSLIFNQMSTEQLDFYLGPLVKSDPFRFLGGLCLPVPVDSFLLGLGGIMTVSYYTSHQNRRSEGFQRWPLRGFIFSMVLISLGTTINLWIWTTKALVVQFGSYHEIYDGRFYMAFYILGVLLVTPVHIYWSIRIFKLYKRNWYILAILLTGATVFGTSMGMLTAEVARDKTMMASAARPLWILAMRISVYSHVAMNLSGTILTIWGFKRSGKLVGFRKSPVSMSLLVAAESLALPTVFSLFVFFMFTISGRVDSAVPSMILSSKLYVICILHVLNHHASLAEAARIENFYGSGDDNKRHSALDGRMNPAVLQLGALSKHGGRSRHDAYNNDFDLGLERQYPSDSTNNLVEYKGEFVHFKDEPGSIRSHRSTTRSSEEDYK